MPLAQGSNVGPYEVISTLDSGGMGDVYRARDTRLDRMVALKVIGGKMGGADEVQRFELEAKATSAISHPNIIALYDVGEHEGAPYLVTELLDGETLRARLKRGRISAAKAIQYGRQIASGLAAAHDRHIVHRDLKPENVFITSDDHLKILDFGLAKKRVTSASEATTGEVISGLTKVGSIVGTVDYMSPEQASGEDVDHRSDIFSFGTVLFEMLTGRAAFSGRNYIETMHAILTGEPEGIDALSETEPLAAFVVRQCLEKNPRNRFQSARDIELHLGAIASGRISTDAVAAAAPRRRWWLLPLAAVAIVSAMAGAWFFGGRTAMIAVPDYRQLTFRHGYIDAARFTGDGHTVVYSASWDGSPLDMFSTRLENPESRSLDVSAATLLSVSSTGEMAIAINRQRLFGLTGLGTLARVPIVGGVPREIMKDVVQADWSPDGAGLAVIRLNDGKFRLEYPAGTLLYETAGGIADVRVSRDGRTVAFTEHPAPSDDRGDICVIGPDRVKRVVSAGWTSATGLAWAPRGNEIWFSASEVGQNTSLWAIEPGGKPRLLIKSLGRTTVLDVDQNGQALISDGRLRLVMAYRDGLQTADRMLSWLDASAATDISADGSTVIFDEQGEGSRGYGYSVYIRRSDGASAVRLGEGSAGSLSPDGQRVAALTVGTPQSVTILPTGAGEASLLARGPIVDFSAVTWMPDGQSVVFSGREQGHPTKLYLQGLKDGTPRAVSPEGYTFAPYTAPISPDGRTVVALDYQGESTMISLGDGTVQPLKGAQPGDTVVRWTADGQGVFAVRKRDNPWSIWRLGVDNGRRELVLNLAPTDRAGYAGLVSAQITPDGRHLLYSFGQYLMDLYVVKGLQ